MKTFLDAMVGVRDSLKRKMATFSVCEQIGGPGQTGAVVSLVVAAPDAIRLGAPSSGFVLVLGLNRKQLERLRDEATEALKKFDPS